MINLIVGTPGSGKTQFMISKILEIIKENDKLEEQGLERRKIYSDIKELLIPEVDPAPDDWRDTPDGSIIIYDEVQMRREFEYKGNQYSQDPMIKDLTIHRHTNKDLWLITQDSQRIEKGIHKLIDRMFFIKRPASKPTYTNVFEFDKWLSNPEPAANRNAKFKKYLDFYRFNFTDKYQSLYKSASDHSSIKFKLPKQLFVFLGIFLAVIAFVLIALMNTDTFNTKRFEEKNATAQENTSTGDNAVSKKDSKEDNQSANAPIDLSVECRKGVNVEKPECVKWFNDLSKNGSSVNASGVQTVAYNPNKPFDDLSQNLTYEITSKPVFSGCAKFNGKYYGYTEQGTKLLVSKSDCVKLIEHGDRPYNYFKTEQSYQHVKQDSPSPEQPVHANSQPETIPKVDAQIKSEPIPYGTKPQKDISGAHTL
ncbi:zonular occludens toxin domain-containing protein [Acinetobacter johnsonii]|uniref:zonular occludens toxin domain-containing protein n=1 Tax=Acinetobacter johnsonii TaxID=40214 RepID=UPI0032B52181